MEKTTRPDYSRLTALVFDSGVGGLTIAQALNRAAPELTVHYAADTEFFPYGNKSDDDLRRRLPRVAQSLCAAIQPDVFVIACNTASTLALPEVRTTLSIPVIGTVPAIKPAAALSRTGVIGLLATPGTIGRAYTDQLVKDHADGTQVIKHGSVDLVRLAEAVARGEVPPFEEFERAQAPLFEHADGRDIDTVVLACTHFPLVLDQLLATAPHPVAYIDSGDAIARQSLRVLKDCSPTGNRAIPPTAHITGADRVAPNFATVFKRFGFERLSSVFVETPARVL